VAEGSHSWSEFLIPMKLNNRALKYFIVTVDNTFNDLYWEDIELKKIPKWKNYIGNEHLAKWYNKKAKSQKELRNINNHFISKKAMLRIENKLVEYLKRKINER